MGRIASDVWKVYKRRFVAGAAYPHDGKKTGWKFSRQSGLDWVNHLLESEALPVPRLPFESDDLISQPAQTQETLDFATTVRDALNAAWVCRLQYAKLNLDAPRGNHPRTKSSKRKRQSSRWNRPSSRFARILSNIIDGVLVVSARVNRKDGKRPRDGALWVPPLKSGGLRRQRRQADGEE